MCPEAGNTLVMSGRREDDRDSGATTTGGGEEEAATVELHSDREDNLRWGIERGGPRMCGDMVNSTMSSPEKKIGQRG